MLQRLPFCTFFLLSLNVFAQWDSLRGLQTETFLHPGDGFTAYTLTKNELIYNQSPFTAPLPSWAWWGITDRITAEIDLLPLIGGLFQKPHLPVPSFNFRFRLREQQGMIPAMAFETMFQHLWVVQNQLDVPAMRVEREKGSSWYNRVNLSWYNQRKTRFHLSMGATYSENLRIETTDTLNYNGRFFKRTVNPDISASWDWRPLPWLSTHVTGSYGSTFVYTDNIPRKHQLTYGFRFAPFYKNKFGFLNSFRIELMSISMYFADAGKSVSTYLPVFPYFYWQWRM